MIVYTIEVFEETMSLRAPDQTILKPPRHTRGLFPAFIVSTLNFVKSARKIANSLGPKMDKIKCLTEWKKKHVGRMSHFTVLNSRRKEAIFSGPSPDSKRGESYGIYDWFLLNNSDAVSNNFCVC